MSDMTSSSRIAVDIGGTFTDLVMEEGGRVVATVKILTTPLDPSEAVVAGIRELLSEHVAEAVVEIIHGTTLVSNALIERKGVATALLTTAGFRDVLAMGKEQRYDLYDLFIEMPEPLVPRRWRFGVTERILIDGSIDTPLEEEELVSLCDMLRSEGVRSLAICFLHSYRNAEHELRARDLILGALADVSVCISSEVSPEIGEYDRVSTTVANAYVLPVVDHYLALLENRLREIGVAAPLRVMLSNGGLAATETARRFPVRLLESGPAAGVLSAAALGADAVSKNLLAFDMGGTTAKAAIVEGGKPLISREHEVTRVYRFTKGSGLPIRVPVIDMIEIGAGGGSIARVGLFGLPKVGPDSASAVPGPAAYGLGGTEPTVTDADLVLGYLDAQNFLGGEMVLDQSAATEVLTRLGVALGLDATGAAAAVHRVVNENMASAARMHAVERGKDIRSYSLVATGGAGPVHAWGVARALGLRRIVFPPRAGVASAFGMLTAPPAFEFARSLPSLLAEVRWEEVDAALAEMLAEGQRQLNATGASAQEVTISVDVRFEGQGGTLTVELGKELPTRQADSIAERFNGDYERIYGSRPTDVDPEVITWRMRVAGPAPDPDIAPPRATKATPDERRRRMWFAEAGGFVDGAVHDRKALPIGFALEGPAVIEERESTIVIGPGGSAVVEESGNVVVTIDV